jgi:hypothetical protein
VIDQTLAHIIQNFMADIITGNEAKAMRRHRAVTNAANNNKTALAP